MAGRQQSNVHQSQSIAAGGQPPPPTAKAICGKPILDSPYNYHGAPGPYSSGTAGLPTYGTPGCWTSRAAMRRGSSVQTMNYQNWQLRPDTIYYLEPGVHIGNFSADANDAFVGGYSAGTRTTLSGNYNGNPWAISSDSGPGVTMEYLTIEKYQPPVDQAAINQSGSTGWIIQYNTITLNVPGGGAFASTDGVVKDNCMTLNGQYGFQSAAAQSFDSVTRGPYNITIEDNEISYNDTCDLSGLMNNPAIGWHNYNPVPAKYQSPKCSRSALTATREASSSGPQMV